jgi:hypothetical protein
MAASKTFRLVMAGPAEGRVPAISLNAARPRPDDRDHRDQPLRGGPVMTRRGLCKKVIYGDGSNRKRSNINKLLIDDRTAPSCKVIYAKNGIDAVDRSRRRPVRGQPRSIEKVIYVEKGIYEIDAQAAPQSPPLPACGER